MRAFFGLSWRVEATMARAGVRIEVFALVFLSAAAAAALTQDASREDYGAAVVEFSPKVRNNKHPEENMLENVRAVEEFMMEAKRQDVDIIVFPEVGLKGYGNLPFFSTVNLETNPCSNASAANATEPLRQLSCLAAKYGMFLVVNLDEELACQQGRDPGCPARGTFHYNTNVAFDRDGNIVARYRKYHLFGEFTTDTTPEVEISTFDTDFGVRFGMFICFDVLYEKPPLELVRGRNITDVILSTAWFSEVPFLTAVQAHSAWAHALDVNVLAAGLNYPPMGSTGSGVYRGRHGVLDASFTGSTESRMLVQRVPTAGHWDDLAVPPRLERFDPVLNYAAGAEDAFADMKRVRMLQDNMTMYSTRLLARPALGEEHDLTTTLCNGDLCCDFELRQRGVSLMPVTSAAASLHAPWSLPWQRAATPVEAYFNKTEAEDNFDGFHYRLAAFSGVRDHSRVASTGVQICAVMSCLSKDLASCGWLAPNLDAPDNHWTEFVSIGIKGTFPRARTLQLASTLAGPRYEPLPASIYSFKSKPIDSSKQIVSLQLNQPLLDLRTFAIYGRNFDWDNQKPTGYRGDA